MSEHIVNALKRNLGAILELVQSIASRYLAPITEGVRSITDLMTRQTKFIQKGFSDQIVYNLLTQTSAIKTKIIKHNKIREHESKRIDSKKEFLEVQVDELRNKSKEICDKLDVELKKRVEKLDKYALNFLDNSYSNDVSNYLNEFELPALDRIKVNEQAVIDTRVSKIDNTIDEVLTKARELTNEPPSIDPKFLHSVNKSGVVSIKYLKVRYKKPNGSEETEIIMPSVVRKSNDKFYLKELF